MDYFLGTEYNTTSLSQVHVTALWQRTMKDILSEIKTAEEKRAGELTARPGFISWVKATRQKYIVEEFITYFYAYQGRFSRGYRRAKNLGDYVLPTSRTGELFDEENQAHVHNEQTWFWLYLTMGYEALHHKPTYNPAENPLPSEPPCQRIWEDLCGILFEHDLLGSDLAWRLPDVRQQNPARLGQCPGRPNTRP